MKLNPDSFEDRAKAVDVYTRALLELQTLYAQLHSLRMVSDADYLAMCAMFDSLWQTAQNLNWPWSGGRS